MDRSIRPILQVFRRVMTREGLINVARVGFGAIGLALVLLLFRNWRQSPFERHFDFPLPSSAHLLHYHKRTSGFSDTSYAFVFDVNDRALCDLIVKEWKLIEAAIPVSFVSLDPPPWWPIEADGITPMKERYGWEDEQAEEYKSVWYDVGENRLYVEFGNW